MIRLPGARRRNSPHHDKACPTRSLREVNTPGPTARADDVQHGEASGRIAAGDTPATLSCVAGCTYDSQQLPCPGLDS